MAHNYEYYLLSSGYKLENLIINQIQAQLFTSSDRAVTFTLSQVIYNYNKYYNPYKSAKRGDPQWLKNRFMRLIEKLKMEASM